MAAQKKWRNLNSSQRFDSITFCVTASFLAECFYSINVLKDWKSETNELSCFQQF